MSKKIFSKLFSLLFISLLVACSDDSSDSPTSAPLQPYSSSITADFFSSSSLTEFDSTLSSSSMNETPTLPDSLAILPDADGFYAIADVYKIIKNSDKVAFLLRHAERIDDLSQEATLTEKGETQSIQLGESLAGEDEFYYASSGFVRTTETCKKVALGRGEGNVEVVAWDGLDGNYFVLDTALFNKYSKIRGGAWKVLAKWAYTGTTPDAFYNLNERGDQYISEVILPAMNSWENQVAFLSSHDVLLMPLTVYASKGTIDLKFHENGRWINYLTGIAIIRDENGNVNLLPVKGLETGIMGVNG